MVLARRDAEALGDEDLRRNIEGHSSNLGKLLRDKRRSEARTGDKALLEAELRGRLVKTGLKYPVREIYIFKPAPAAATYIAHLDIGDAPLSDAERHLGSLGETLRSVDGFSSYTFGIGVLQGENARILPFILTPRKSTSRSETRMTKEALIRQLGTLELSEFVRHFESFDKGRIRHLLQLLKEIGEANLINPERALEILVILERANIRDYFPNDEEVLAPLRGAEDALREIVRSDPEIKMMKEMIGSEGLVKAIGVTDRVISEGIIETFNRVAAGEKADALEGLIFASLEPLGISEVEEAFTRGLTNSVDRFIWDNTDSEVLPISIEIASHLGWLATTGAFLGQPFAYERINFYERALESGSVPQRRIAASFFSNFYQAGITDSPELLGKLKRMVEDRGEIPEIRADAFEALSKNAFAVEADFFSPYFENREKETFEIPFSPEKRPSFQALLKALKIGDDLAQKKAGRSGYILELMDVFPDYETSGESLLQLTVVAVVFQQFLGQTIDLVDAPIILANLARALRSEVREEQTFFTGTYTATMDDRFRIFVPNGLRRGAGVEKSLAVVVTPEGVIRVYPKTVWERLLREGTPGDPEAVEAYKRRIIPNTYFLTLDSIGRLTLINEIRERGSVAQRFNFTGNAKPTRVKLVGIGPFFEIQPQGKEEEKSLSRSEARLPVLGKEDALRALTRAKRQADLEEAAAGAVLEEAIRQIGTFNLSDLPQKDDWGDFFRYISYDLAKQREPRPFGEGIERQAGFALNYFVEAVQFRPPSDRRLVLTAFLKAILAGSLLGFLAKLVYFLLPRRNLSGEKPPERRNRKEALPAETHGLASAPGRASAERSEVRIVRVDSLDLEKDLAEGFGELGKLVREAARKAEHRNAAGFLLRRTSPANEADRRNWEALGFRPAPVLIPQVIGLLTDRDKGTFLEWFTDSGLRKEEIGKLSSQLRTEEEEYQRKVRALRTAIGPLVELSLKTLRAAYSKASDQGLFVKPALAPSAKEYQEDLAHVIFRIEQFKDYSMQSIPFALILESEDEERALRRAWEEVGREAGQILEWIRLLSHGRVSVRSPEEALVPQKKADQKAAEVQVTGRRIARRSEMRKDKEEIVREVLRSRLTRRARGRNLSLIKKRRGAVEKSGRESKQIAVNLESIFQEGLGVPIPVHEITSVELFDPHPPDSVRSEARNDPAAPREDPAQHWKEFLDYLLRSLAPDLPVSNGRKAKPTLSLKDNNRGIALFIPNPSKGAGEGVRFSMSNGRHPDAARYSISASVISKVGERLDTQRIKSNLTRESLHDFILQVLTEEQVTPRWREHLGDWAKEVNEFRARFREEWASYEEAGRQESLLVLRNAKGEKMELLLFNSGDFRISLPPRDGITREWVLSEEGLAERRLPEDLQTSFKTFFQEINAFLLLKFASSQEKISLTDGPSREFLWLGIGGWKILMPIHDSGTFSQRLRDHLFLDTNLIFENGTVKTVQDLEKEIRASLPKSREEAERVLGRSETRPEERLVPLTEKLLNLISEWEKSEMIREAAGSFWKTIQSLKRTLLEFRTRLFGDPAYYDPAKSGKFAPLEGGLLEAHQSLLRFKKETDSGFFRLNFWKLYGYLIESLQALLDYRRTRVSGWARDLSKAKNVEHQELIVQEMTQELKRAELLFEVLKDTLEKDGIRGPFRDSLQRSLARLETVKSRLANRAQGRSEMRRSIERAVALATLPGEGDSVRRAALDWFGTEVPRESAQYLIEMTLREETEELEREVSERIRHFFAEYEASLLRRESENVTRFGEEMIGAFEAILKEAGGLNERAVYLGFEAPREESWRGMEAALGKALKRFRPLIKNVIVTSRRENGRLPSSLTKLLGTLNLRSPVVDRQLKVKSLLEVEQQKKLGLFSPGESGLDSGRLPGEVVPVRLEGRYEDLSPFEQEAVFLAGVLLALAQGLGIESEGLKKFVDLFDPETFKFGKNSVTIRLAAFVESLNAERASQERLSSAA
jgi:DNA-binding transcriptional regulator/RsmH inhibitor MraZ